MIYKAIIFSIIYGVLEARIMSQGFRTKKPRLFGQFAIYHGLMLLMFLVVAWPCWWYPLLMAVVQDRFYFVFKKDDRLGPEDWVNWKLGGFYIPQTYQWVPHVYWIALTIYAIIEGIYYYARHYNV